MIQEHILVVEDEKKIADILKDYLEKSGFTVTCLNRGDEVLEKIKFIRPDLILLDIMLPGKDGIAVCREIRKSADTPIIMVTAKVEEVDCLVGLEIGADDYICKPFSPREVVARVKAVLRRARPIEKPRRLIIGPFILDEDTRQVTVDKEPISLTPSEFSLLHLLMSSPDRVFTRNELLDKIQGYRFEGYDRTIDSHVKNLRKKIAERLPDKEFIQTVYGIGYKLNL